MNILFISVDSLRSDHLGISGYHRDTSPNIDALAKKGVLFTSLIPTVPRTAPSIASTFTGLYPHNHGIRFIHTDKLKQGVSTLAEILKSRGYRTVGHAIEIENTELDRGFDSFNPVSWRVSQKVKRGIKKIVKPGYKENPAEMMTDFGIKQLDANREYPFFIFLHYIGTHWPYRAPGEYAEKFDPDYKGSHRFNEVNGEISRGDLIFNNSLTKEENEHAMSHYDNCIAYVDFQIGRLIEHLDKLGLREKTLIVLDSDHGECFGEHGMYFEHGEYLYDEAMKVPLVISHSSLSHKVITTQVQVTDTLPTLLELLKIPLLDKVDGVSLLPLINENKKVREYTFCETDRNYYKQNKRIYIDGVKGKWRCIRTDEWKLIFIPHPEKGIFELYNLKEDPLETKNVVEEEPEQFEKLKKELFDWIQDLGEQEEVDLTEKSKKLLKKLGYME